MHAKWKFGLVVLLVPNLLDACAALARLRQQSVSFGSVLVRTYQCKPFTRCYVTCPPLQESTPPHASGEVHVRKMDTYAEVFACANAMRAARRQYNEAATKLAYVAFSSKVPQNIIDQLTSENATIRARGKAELKKHLNEA